MPWDGGGEEISSTNSPLGSSCRQRWGWFRRQRCWGRPSLGCRRRRCNTKRSQAQANGLAPDLDVSNLGREMEGTRHTGFWKNLPFAPKGSKEPRGNSKLSCEELETQLCCIPTVAEKAAEGRAGSRQCLRRTVGHRLGAGACWAQGWVPRLGARAGWQRVAALL